MNRKERKQLIKSLYPFDSYQCMKMGPYPHMRNFGSWSNWDNVQYAIWLKRHLGEGKQHDIHEDFEPSETQALALSVIKHGIVHELANKFRIVERLQDFINSRGMVAVEVWQMDCDCSAWTTLNEIKPSYYEYEKLRDSVYDGAEGPVRFSFLEPEMTDTWESESRDLAMEAHENGHDHIVYI